MAVEYKITVTGKTSDGKTTKATVLNKITEAGLGGDLKNVRITDLVTSFQKIVTYKIERVQIESVEEWDPGDALNNVTPGTDTWQTEDEVKFIELPDAGSTSKQTMTYKKVATPILNQNFGEFASAIEELGHVPIEAYLRSTSDTGVWSASD